MCQLKLLAKYEVCFFEKEGQAQHEIDHILEMAMFEQTLILDGSILTRSTSLTLTPKLLACGSENHMDALVFSIAGQLNLIKHGGV